MLFKSLGGCWSTHNCWCNCHLWIVITSAIIFSFTSQTNMPVKMWAIWLVMGVPIIWRAVGVDDGFVIIGAFLWHYFIYFSNVLHCCSIVAMVLKIKGSSTTSRPLHLGYFEWLTTLSCRICLPLTYQSLNYRRKSHVRCCVDHDC